MKLPATSRRRFLTACAASLGASSVVSPSPVQAEEKLMQPVSNQLRIYKSVKWNMIEGFDTLIERFQVCRELGYDGMELESPIGLNAQVVRLASEETGMPVHGVVDGKHWQDRLSSPDPKVRERGMNHLELSIKEANAFGGHSVLLVPGAVKGSDENHNHVWDRSIIEIRKVLPLASRLGVRILIENVWNGFCETPEQFRDYIDEIDSPWVGAYFDIGNCRKFSRSEDWIRILSSRIVKLDVKDWSQQNGFCKIGSGDVNWPAVREALAEIRFSGWATAEVPGGDANQLREIGQRMNQVFALS